MNEARLLQSDLLLRDGTVLVAGGRSSDGHVLRSAERYNPQTRSFQRVGDMSQPRYKHTAGLLPDGRVLLAGGSTEKDWRAQLTSAEIFDPSTNQFTRTAALNEQRFKLPEYSFTLPTGEMVIAGGAKHIELFDPTQRTFRVVDGDLPSEHYMSETALKDGSILLAGGYDDPAQDAQSTMWLVAVRRDSSRLREQVPDGSFHLHA
jgi:hypothetical protein